ELAAEVAPGRAERQHRGAGQEVIERLLLDRVDAEARALAVGREDELVAFARAHEAERALAVVQPAVARAEIALDAPVVEGVPPAGGVGVHGPGDYGRERPRGRFGDDAVTRGAQRIFRAAATWGMLAACRVPSWSCSPSSPSRSRDRPRRTR